MTDRELLELAAKAAGIEFGEWHDSAGLSTYTRWRGFPQQEWWNPLTDDGDALRLAVKLRLNITFTAGLGAAHADEYMQVVPRSLGHLAEFGPLGTVACATIRRAIVCAAAAVWCEEGPASKAACKPHEASGSDEKGEGA